MKTVAGLVILSLIVGFVAVASTPTTSTVETKSQGRYQLVLNPNVRADVFLLDTQTGKIWTPVEITNVKDERTKAGIVDRRQWGSRFPGVVEGVACGSGLRRKEHRGAGDVRQRLRRARSAVTQRAASR